MKNKNNISISLTPEATEALQWEIDWSHSFRSFLNRKCGHKKEKKPTIKEKAQEIIEDHCRYWPK